MDSDWSVHPGIGLGRLKFGMTPEDVKTLEGIYGKVTWEWISSPPSEEHLKSTEQFLACLSPEERAVQIEKTE